MISCLFLILCKVTPLMTVYIFRLCYINHTQSIKKTNKYKALLEFLKTFTFWCHFNEKLCPKLARRRSPSQHNLTRETRVLCHDISRYLVDHFKWYVLNCQNVFNVFSIQSNLGESMWNIVIMVVFACGLAPLGARISASIEINKIGSCVYIRSFFILYLITWKLISLH